MNSKSKTAIIHSEPVNTKIMTFTDILMKDDERNYQIGFVPQDSFEDEKEFIETLTGLGNNSFGVII